MPASSTTIKSTVSQFAGTLGLTALESSDGSFSFEYSESGKMAVTLAVDERRVLVSLTRRTMLDGYVAMMRFLQLSGQLPDGRVLQVGLTTSDQPVLILGIEEQQFDVPTLDRTVSDLRGLFQSVGF